MSVARRRHSPQDNERVPFIKLNVRCAAITKPAPVSHDGGHKFPKFCESKYAVAVGRRKLNLPLAVYFS